MTPKTMCPLPGHVLVLRTCDENMVSRGGFRWPMSGEVAAPDWLPTVACGHGLHGLLWGEGDGALLDWSETARWLVVEVEAEKIVDLDGKVKFPSGAVVYCGDRVGAVSFLADHGGAGRAIAGGTAVAGDNGAATAGYRGTATAGAGGTATAGYRGTATAGDNGAATAGDNGAAAAGYRGTATAGANGAATAGAGGTATAGAGGTATAGDNGAATAGYRGTATAGDNGAATAGAGGTATAGAGGTATAGYRGEIRIRWWDGAASRFRTTVGYVGEGGLLPGVAYALDAAHALVQFG
jgi:hypothetical protein